MNTLAIDTSGPVLSVALQCGSAPVREKVHPGALEHMEHILVFIDSLLRSENTGLENISRFFINRGPGSFTGLRIGFSILKGFLAAGPKPCFGFESPDVLAERIPAESRYLAVCFDAFRSKFYVKLFENKNGWLPVSDSRAMTFEQALSFIPEGACIAGDGLKRHQNVFLASEKKFSFAAEELWYPRASSMLNLEKIRPAAVRKLISSEDFLPAYLRQSEPEERRDEK